MRVLVVGAGGVGAAVAGSRPGDRSCRPWCWRARDGTQAVVWQTAVNPVAALELIAAGLWSGAGVLGPEAFDPVPFLDLLPDYGAVWRVQDRTPAL